MFRFASSLLSKRVPRSGRGLLSGLGLVGGAYLVSNAATLSTASPHAQEEKASETQGTTAKRFYNAPSAVISDMLVGLMDVRPDLALLDGGSDVQVVVPRAYKSSENKERVALISGGGSGHEPAHAGYVGEGMLTAAVVGQTFASPSVEAVYSAIRHVSLPAAEGGKGVLLIVKNYTGDRLNFGLAAEMARDDGIDVRMVVVGDDCALRDQEFDGSVTGRRGLAGTVLVEKVCGALSKRGASLDLVERSAQSVAANVGTVGIAFSACSLPGQPLNTRLAHDNVAEFGLGIHGEPGAETLAMEPASSLVRRMVSRILWYPKSGFSGGDEVAVMINNLGASTNMELLIATREVVDSLTAKGYVVRRVYTGAYMTSLDMQGVSVTIMNLDQKKGKSLEEARQNANVEQTLALLDASTTAFGWVPAAPQFTAAMQRGTDASRATLPLHASMYTEAQAFPSSSLTSFGLAVKEAVAQGSMVLVGSAVVDELDALDRAVGDGDCGATHRRGASAVLCALNHDEYELNNAVRASKQLSHTLCKSMGGTSGALYSIFFLRASQALAQRSATTTATPEDLAVAFSAGVEGIRTYGGAKEGDRTMLDALVPAEQWLAEIKTDTDVKKAHELLGKAVHAAEQGAKSTALMQVANAGRSSYVPSDNLQGVADPGAMAVAQWMRAVYDATK